MTLATTAKCRQIGRILCSCTITKPLGVTWLWSAPSNKGRHSRTPQTSWKCQLSVSHLKALKSRSRTAPRPMTPLLAGKRSMDQPWDKLTLGVIHIPTPGIGLWPTEAHTSSLLVDRLSTPCFGSTIRTSKRLQTPTMRKRVVTPQTPKQEED